MPVHSIDWLRNNGDIVGIRICKASNDCQDFPFAGVVMPDSQEKADAIAEFIQEEYLDSRVRLNTLERDDDARYTDPALLREFWEGDGNPAQTNLVSRSVLVTIEWTGTEYVPTLRRIR